MKAIRLGEMSGFEPRKVIALAHETSALIYRATAAVKEDYEIHREGKAPGDGMLPSSVAYDIYALVSEAVRRITRSS